MRLRAALSGSALLALGILLAGCFLLQPQAKVDFDASAVEGPQPLVVSFTPVSEESPISFAWDFGDGSVSNEPDPVHVYKAAGTYTVSLDVELADGRVATETKIDLVTVSVSLRKESSPMLYWVNDHGLLKSAGRGGLGETVVAERFFSVAGMEFVGNKLYWLDYSRQSIYRANADGSGQETLVHTRELYYLPWDFAVDPVGEKMYWVCMPHDTSIDDAGDDEWVWRGGIHRANLDGSNVETLITYPAGASEYATHVAVDPFLGRVYWCLQSGSTWKLQYSPTGSWIPRTVCEGDGSLRGLALDTIYPIGAKYAYFLKGSKVQRVRIAGGSPADVVTGIGLSFDIAVDAFEGKLYVATWGGIVRANVSGSEKEVLFPEEDVNAAVLR